MRMVTEKTMTYCVGCGKPYAPVSAFKRGLALACGCGANAPIAVVDLNDPEAKTVGLPLSLLRAIGSRNIPHLEYYLGFSSFTCPAKEVLVKALMETGCISMADCKESQCKDNYLRSVLV